MRLLGPLVLLLLAADRANGFRLHVLHTNDMHARFEETSASGGPCSANASCYGGFARIAAEVRRLKALSPEDTLFLNAGDTYQGTPYYYVYKWNIVLEFIQKIGIDVMSLGNHEFDDGVEGLEPYLRRVKIPNVAANLDLRRYPSLTSKEVNLKPAVNINIRGVNITIIGYVTPDTKFLSRPEVVEFYDEVPILRKLAKEAKQGGARIVIALGHSGFPMDKKIAEEVEDVDLVVGGHTNTFLYTGPPPDLEVPESTYPHMVRQPSGKQVPVVQAYCHTKYLGSLTLDFDDKDFRLINATGNPILLNSSFPQDPQVVADLLEWRMNMSARLDEVVGRHVVDLSGQCRGGECNLGNFFTDAVIDYHVREMEGQLHQNSWTNAPIAVMNSGAIRTSLNLNETKGSVTEGDILTVVPFDNTMVIVTVTGATLMEVLEKSVSNYDIARDRGKGNFLQVSGLRVSYDLGRPEGRRVTQVEARCGSCLVPEFLPLNLTSEYNLIVSEYLCQGGDGFDMLAQIPLEKRQKLDWREVDAFRTYSTKNTPFYPGLEGRIRWETSAPSGGSRTRAAHLVPLIAVIVLLSALLAGR